MFCRLTIGLVMFVLANVSYAQYFNGQRLHEMVNASNRVDRHEVSDPDDFGLNARLNGYILGVADTATTGRLICPPYGTSAGQLVAIVAKYVTDNPDKWGKSGDWIVINALAPVFPCLRSK